MINHQSPSRVGLIQDGFAISGPWAEGQYHVSHTQGDRWLYTADTEEQCQRWIDQNRPPRQYVDDATEPLEIALNLLLAEEEHYTQHQEPERARLRELANIYTHIALAQAAQDIREILDERFPAKPPSEKDQEGNPQSTPAEESP
jgi:hypothetical protein